MNELIFYRKSYRIKNEIGLQTIENFESSIWRRDFNSTSFFTLMSRHNRTLTKKIEMRLCWPFLEEVPSNYQLLMECKSKFIWSTRIGTLIFPQKTIFMSFAKLLRSLNNLIKQWKVRTIFDNRMLFNLFQEVSCIK